ncbi:PILR alpha-associated neural protein [Conger conger]|uniref:PILR alpha-associated neural protein n=1 Tax=Conger conger TaxID=82655 RepID=UPI002A5A4C61|nr:PILR alpha-associated neural protein [Conger conger]XP_061092491.1 PILR alpha-associated neural protein [Conger conger]
MERCSISPVTRLAALCCLLVAATTRPASCDGGQRKADGGESEGRRVGDPRIDTHPPQPSVTTQATPTPLWAVIWGPTHPVEDETLHFLSGQEAGDFQRPTTESWQLLQNPPTTKTQQLLLGERKKEGEEDEEGEAESDGDEVDPQFYVTVTISSLLILTAVIITAKLCYDRSCSRHPPPLSRGGAPPLSLSLPRALAPEDSRQVLHSTPSFTDGERIPVVNL